MSQTKFTPGPYKVVDGPISNGVEDENIYCSIQQEGHNDLEVAAVWSDCDNPKGTANLLAAAPVLHEALQMMVDYYAGMVAHCECANWDPEKEFVMINARAALEKANP